MKQDMIEKLKELGCVFTDEELCRFTYNGVELRIYLNGREKTYPLYLWDMGYELADYGVSESEFIKEEMPNNIGVPTAKKLNDWIEFLTKRRCLAEKNAKANRELIAYNMQRLINAFGEDKVLFKPYRGKGFEATVENGSCIYKARCDNNGTFHDELKFTWSRYGKIKTMQKIMAVDLSNLEKREAEIGCTAVRNAIDKGLSIVPFDNCWYMYLEETA